MMLLVLLLMLTHACLLRYGRLSKINILVRDIIIRETNNILDIFVKMQVLIFIFR